MTFQGRTLSAFVTGATGFLGLNLIAELSRRGWDITALHRAGSDLKYLPPISVLLNPAHVVGSYDRNNWSRLFG